MRRCGTPDDFTELLDVQFEMMALACQTDQTRIATLRMIKEASMRTFPTVHVDEAFHPLSHHGEDPDKQEKLRARADLPDRALRASSPSAWPSIKEGDDNLLDNSDHPVRSNIANSDLHNCSQLPALMLGKGGGLQGQPAHLPHPQDTPHANLLLTMAQRAGVQAREVRRHHRHLQRGLMTCARGGSPGGGIAAALLSGAAASPAARHGNVDATASARRQHAAAVGGLRGRRRRGEAPARSGADVQATNNYGVNAMQLAADIANTELIAGCC